MNTSLRMGLDFSVSDRSIFDAEEEDGFGAM